MGDPLDGLTGAQREAVTWSHGGLVVAGVPGSGKTEVLARRVCWWSREQLLAPHRPLVVARDAHGCAALAGRIEALLGDAVHEELAVYSIDELCARLVADRAKASGIEELTPVVTAAERLALLLERVDELELRHHDFRGRPLVLLAAIVRRIDRLKLELVGCEDFAAGAEEAGDREFAGLYKLHEQILREHGVLDAGGQLIACVRMLERDSAIATGLALRHPKLLVDDWQSRSRGQRELLLALAGGGCELTATGDIRDQAGVLELAGADPSPGVVRLAWSFRCPQQMLDAARAIDPAVVGEASGPGGSERAVRFWRCTTPRAGAQRTAGELDHLTRVEGVDPARCAVIVRSVTGDGPGVAEALGERGVAHRLLGAGAFFERTEVRDVLAWLRLLIDPRDAAAVVRALSRPPIELHAVDVARCLQLARRRKLDMVTATGVALSSAQLLPEACERLTEFLELQRASAAGLDEERSDLFVHQLIERLGLRRHQLFTAHADVVERLVNLGRLEELAARHQRALPSSTPREFAAYAAAVGESGIGEPEIAQGATLPAVVVGTAADVAGREFDHVFVLTGVEELDGAGRRALCGAITRASQQLVLGCAPTAARLAAGGVTRLPVSSLLEHARAALAVDWEEVAEELFGPAATLHALFGERREELLDSVARVGARLGELRFDTDLDVTHAVVRLLELVKLAALLERRAEQPLAEALADINSRLAAAATPLEREILLSSPLDGLLAGEQVSAGSTTHLSEEPSLAHFLPRRGDGLVLSASDVEAYRACPLRYKFARVLRIPREPTLNQRFGIVVHQVLERYHQHSSNGDGTAAILGLLDIAWRRGGFGDSGEERQLHTKARNALVRYQERLEGSAGVAPATAGKPRWFERSFRFQLGPHVLRGRVDRIDELPGGGYQLIDYKTGPPKRQDQLREDLQLALYARAALEAWQLEATERTYYYVLDDERVSLGQADASPAWVEETIVDAGAGILAQSFEPTPSRAVCSLCDYRIACPVAER
ncbi:MAG: ATP-dependent DNA helicase [Solirubrobacteraceae bacterium]